MTYCVRLGKGLRMSQESQNSALCGESMADLSLFRFKFSRVLEGQD